jgi:hypothetical protein
MFNLNKFNGELNDLELVANEAYRSIKAAVETDNEYHMATAQKIYETLGKKIVAIVGKNYVHDFVDDPESLYLRFAIQYSFGTGAAGKLCPQSEDSKIPLFLDLHKDLAGIATKPSRNLTALNTLGQQMAVFTTHKIVPTLDFLRTEYPHYTLRKEAGGVAAEEEEAQE